MGFFITRVFFMSAIWGFVNLDRQEALSEKGLLMEKEYHKFKIDSFNTLTIQNAVFGAGVQYLTTVSKSEALPFFDEKNNIIFTADCMLDNRSQLIDELKKDAAVNSLPLMPSETVPDGMLIYMAYLTWGTKMTDHLLGVFAVAIYNYAANKFYLFTDHCSCRCIHYYQKDNTIYFSTLTRPIQAATDYSIELSEKYIAGCESNISASMIIYPGLTPFEGVYQLLAASFLEAAWANGKATCKNVEYWNPVKSVKPLKNLTDDEYRQLFLDIYSKCVTDTLHVDGAVASCLSSGLDSSSVASLAALELNKRGKLLHTYTSVPLNDYVGTDSERLENEREPVEKFCKCFDNIKPTFISCEGKSPLTEIERFVELFNSPLKYYANALWLDEIYKSAAADGCKMVLVGSFGNSSVSYGSFIGRLWYEFKALHFMTMIKQYKAFRRYVNFSRKGVLKDTLTEIAGHIYPKDLLDLSITRDDLIQKYNLEKEYKKSLKHYGTFNIKSRSQRRNNTFMKDAFQQMSNVTVLFELYYGIIIRDPTKDKRIIELCLSLPEKCFADRQYERRLITDYMKDIIPAHTRRQIYMRGKQSADLQYRIKKYPKDYSAFVADNKALLTKYIKNIPYDVFSDDLNVTIASINSLSLLLFLKQNSELHN